MPQLTPEEQTAKLQELLDAGYDVMVSKDAELIPVPASYDQAGRRLTGITISSAAPGWVNCQWEQEGPESLFPAHAVNAVHIATKTAGRAGQATRAAND